MNINDAKALFALPSETIATALEVIVDAHGNGPITQAAPSIRVYAIDAWQVFVSEDGTFTAYREDKPHGSDMEIEFTVQDWMTALSSLKEAQLKQAQERIERLEADKTKLVAQLDHTKALLRHMQDEAQESGRSYVHFVSKTWFYFEPQVTLAEEDWYNTDKSAIVQRYMDGELNESAALYLMETEDRLVLIRAVDAYRANQLLNDKE